MTRLVHDTWHAASRQQARCDRRALPGAASRGLVPILAAVAALAGCASNAAWQAIDLTSSASAPAVAPAGDVGPLPPQVSQQSGQGNVAAQFDASGWKGLEYTTAVPVGQVILLALMLILSHRREVLRIRQNGVDRGA